MPILSDVRAVDARAKTCQLTTLGYISSMETKVLHSPLPFPNSPFPIAFSELRLNTTVHPALQPTILAGNLTPPNFDAQW